MSQLSFWNNDGRQARWAPIHLEPVIGTGEKITVAIALDHGHGINVFPVLRSRFVQEAFGESAEDFQSIVNLIKESLEAAEGYEESIARWEQPFDGVTVGDFTSAMGNSVQDIVDSASALASSFYRSNKSTSKSRRSSDHKSRFLECQIRDSVVKLHPTSRPFFGRAIAGSTAGVDRRLGFFDDFYAAQFGVLTAGSSVGTCRAFTQAKLWDLERLRDTPRLFRDSLRLEFIAQQTNTRAESESSLVELREQLVEEAARAEISFVVVADSNTAAKHVLANSVLAA